MIGLIYKDALIKKLSDNAWNIDEWELPHEQVSAGLMANAMDRETVEEMPTVDAVPVRHGKWINMGDFEQCSVCTATHLKTIQTVYGGATWIKSDYCPNCGARMDKEDDTKGD